MSRWPEVLAALIGAALLLWLGLVVSLWLAQRRQPSPITATQLLRLLPDIVRLTRRLVSDPDVPRGVRIRLALLLAYLLVPIDLVPDFIPVIGYADDAIIAALVIRSAIRASGTAAIARNWPGDDAGLAAVLTLAGRTPP